MLQQVYGGDLNRCINEASIIRTLEKCGSLCPEAAPTPAQMPLPADPTAIPPLQRGSLVDSTTLKIFGAAAVAGILVWLVMKRKK